MYVKKGAEGSANATKGLGFCLSLVGRVSNPTRGLYELLPTTNPPKVEATACFERAVGFNCN